MEYRVLHTFRDTKDNRQLYKAGERYPRLGLEVSEERLLRLSSSKNKAGKPLIELIPSNEIKTPESKQEAPRKRGRKKNAD